MQSKNFRVIDHVTVQMQKLTRIAIIFSILFLVLSGVFFFLYTDVPFNEISIMGIGKFFLLLAFGVVLHELIHGFFFLIFSGFKFTSIKFGFNREYLAPYAHCNVPLKGWMFIISALAPLLLLGVIPFIYGLLEHMISIYFLGAVFVIGAIGDIIIAVKVINTGLSYYILDHPDDLGYTVLNKIT